MSNRYTDLLYLEGGGKKGLANLKHVGYDGLNNRQKENLKKHIAKQWYKRIDNDESIHDAHRKNQRIKDAATVRNFDKSLIDDYDLDQEPNYGVQLSTNRARAKIMPRIANQGNINGYAKKAPSMARKQIDKMRDYLADRSRKRSSLPSPSNTSAKKLGLPAGPKLGLASDPGLDPGYTKSRMLDWRSGPKRYVPKPGTTARKFYDRDKAERDFKDAYTKRKIYGAHESADDYIDDLLDTMYEAYYYDLLDDAEYEAFVESVYEADDMNEIENIETVFESYID